MKTNISQIFSIIFVTLLLALTGCTKMSVKNKALALSVIQFDDEAQVIAKTNFADQEMQKVFLDFTKMNTKMDVDNVELQGNDEATAQLTVDTFPMILVEEFKTISGKDWKAKAEAAKQIKKYNLKLKKIGDAWKITEKVEITK
jgi:hypothetical protein